MPIRSHNEHPLLLRCCPASAILLGTHGCSSPFAADFMAPEMVTGEERQGTAMDWWALGVMLYELVLGRLPFNSRFTTELAMFQSIVNAELSFPADHGLTDDAVDLLLELMQKVKPLQVVRSGEVDVFPRLTAYLCEHYGKEGDDILSGKQDESLLHPQCVEPKASMLVRR